MKSVWNERMVELVPETEADQSELRFLITQSRIIFNTTAVEKDAVDESSPTVLKKVTLLRRI